MAKNWSAAVLCAFAGLLPAPAAAAAGQVVTVTAGDCRRVVSHVAAADVEYRPGLDVRGRKVAPADLGGGPPIVLPDEIAFDIKVDLRNFLGGPAADARAASAAVTAADKAAAAAVTAESAAVAAEAAATEAQAISTAAAAAAAADPDNAALAAAAATAAADAANVAAPAADARAAADTADGAVIAEDKAAAVQQAADSGAAAGAAAVTAAGTDPGKATLKTLGTTANTAAAAAGTGAAAATTANTARTKAFTDAARIGETLGEPVIGRVRIKGFRVYFNDRLLGDMAEAELARKCREMLREINGRN